jgi:tetratricopeptide (TPR) repeat protein
MAGRISLSLSLLFASGLTCYEALSGYQFVILGEYGALSNASRAVPVYTLSILGCLLTVYCLHVLRKSTQSKAPPYPREGDPDDLCGLGLTLQDQGKLLEAVSAFKEAARIKPDFWVAYYYLGNALYAQQKYAEALAAYQKAARLKADDADVHWALGNALYAQQKYAEAVGAYQKAVGIKNDFPEGYCRLGLALQAQGQFEQALGALQRGHELGSKQKWWSYPSAQWVRECRRLVELDIK